MTPERLKIMRGCVGLEFPVDAMQELFAHIDEVEAQCTAMREALNNCKELLVSPGAFSVDISDTVWVGPAETLLDRIEHAQSSDAGKQLLERLEIAEANWKNKERLHQEACEEWLHARTQALEDAARVVAERGEEVPSVGGTYEHGWRAAIQDAAYWIRALAKERA